MENTTEEITYESLMRIINSDDKENVIVALKCLENLDFSEYMHIILLVIRDGNIDMDIWKNETPKLHKKLKKRINISKNILTYEIIFNLLKDNDATNEQVSCIVKSLSKNILEQLQKYGYSYIKDIQITINPEHE